RLGRNGDPSLLFSSWTHGDPVTPVPMAYRGDPFVIRTINVGDAEDTFHVDGHRFLVDPRQTEADGTSKGTWVDTLHYGVSERFTAILDGGAGGQSQRAGDYLFMNGIQRRFEQGAWGMLRVLPRQVPGLQPLPGTNVPAGGSLHVSKLDRDPASSGVNVGFNPEQTVAVGESKTYRFYADSDRLGSATISDFGNPHSAKTGLYGAVVVAPRGAEFFDPASGAP